MVLSHLDADGLPRMVDVSGKVPTRRRAVAAGCLELGSACAEALERGGGPKGDPWAVVRLAAVNGVKRTADLVPLAHPLAVEGIALEPTSLTEHLSDERHALRPLHNLFFIPRMSFLSWRTGCAGRKSLAAQIKS